MRERNSIAVLGIGNLLCRDDGIGIRVVHEMQRSGNFSEVDVIDGGTAPDLIALLDGVVNKLIIVDALKGGGQPGEIYRLELREENIADESTASLHGLGVLDSLKMMRKLGLPVPSVTIIGIEPADISHGLSLSPQLEASVQAIIDAVENEISQSC